MPGAPNGCARRESLTVPAPDQRLERRPGWVITDSPPRDPEGVIDHPRGAACSVRPQADVRRFVLIPVTARLRWASPASPSTDLQPNPGTRDQLGADRTGVTPLSEAERL
jgi:hypothetical protein